MGATGRFTWGGDRRSEAFKLLSQEVREEKDKVRLAKRDRDSKSRNTDEVSDVRNHRTPMSENDKNQLTRGGARYFQSSNSMDINEVLRKAVSQGISEEEAFKQEFGSGNRWGSASWQEQLETVRAMDRNMRPSSEDFNTARMAGNSWLNSVLEQSGINWISAREITRLDYSAKKAAIERIKSNLIGGKIKENAFASSTWNLTMNSNVFTHRPVKIEAFNPKGTKCLFSPTSFEDEVVLSRHGGYIINDITINNRGQIVFKVTTTND